MTKLVKSMITIGLLLVLVACSNHDQTDNDESTIKTFPSTSVEDTDEAENERTDHDKTDDELGNEEEPIPNEQENEPEADHNDDSSPTNIDIIDFEESYTIEKELDITGLTVDIETDNRNNRVILFLFDKQPVYKTIFVKRDNRLKIIDIQNDDGQIFNEIIQ